ncbi:transcription factor 20 [Silurus meridionalis]|nr:transcription factor 20 [Silurus meridionalis]
MDQASDSSDGLQPQEHSASCNLPRVFDLTKNGEECLLKTNAIEALHIVQPPGWYLSSGTNGSVLPADQSDPSMQAGDQIQPDNALSNTTVTLSYVTRSHVFSAHDSLSQHSQIYGVPISKAFSLHPTAYDASQLVSDAAGAPLCVDVDQHCLQQVSVPVGLAACASPFDFVTPAQVVENVASLCYLQQAHNITGIQDVESLALETLRSLQQNGPTECKIPLNLDELQNGAVGSLWNAGSMDERFPAERGDDVADQHKNGNPEVLFLISRTDEPVILPNDPEPAGLAVSLNQELISALEDSMSPPFASLIEVKDVAILHQPAGYEIEENAFAEETNTRQDHVESDPLTSLDERDSSSGTDALITTVSTELTDHTIDTATAIEPDPALSEVQKEDPRGHKTHSPRRLFARKETLVRKELPPRTRRGMRLEAIVQNIFPSRYKSGHISSAKKSQRSQPDESARLGSSQQVSIGDNGSHLKAECPSKVVAETNETAVRSQEVSEETDVAKSNKISTSCSAAASKHSPDIPSLGRSPKPIKKSRKQAKTNTSLRMRKRTARPTSKHKKSSSKRCHLKTAGSKSAKKDPTPKKKRKKHKMGQSSMFSPQEPEIKLKYICYKEEKKEKRDETFSPFVHVELKAYPTCTVINYRDESARLSRGKTPASVAPGKMPTAPCLQFGRVSTEGTRWDTLACCLCGGSANAMDLGDLHGPYYPEGFKPEPRLPTKSREDDSSDSDSSSSQTRKPCLKLQAASRGTYQRWSTDGELSAKRSRVDTVTDWYSPPIVPLEASEYWLHEDCAIWSAGVCLVRGKLYGLDRAVKVAKETICSSCHEMGATLGCFFKGCPNKYHYICAMQSGCVLYEENFSMKCRKHKNKSIKGVSSNKQSIR